MRIWTLVLILLVVFLIVMLLNRRVNKVSGKRIADLLKKTDKRYDEFISKRIDEHIIKKNDFNLDKDRLAKESTDLLKPQIETIISHINAAQGKSIEVNYKKGFFPNVAPLCEHLFLKKERSRQKELSREDENRLFTAFEDSIKADISERSFKLKAGEI
jgi:hypothetical protein